MAGTKIDPSTFKEKIIVANIANKAEEWQKIYGANKNLYRYFPSTIDGLKPVERRFLYGMYLDKRYNGKIIKLARASTNANAFHPHGDSSISDVAIGMSQEWVNNVPLVYTDGNNGSIRGDAPAAPRYLDVTLSEFAYDCYFSDFADANVDMKLAYTGETEEPIILPAKYPVAIINGGFSSIGYGFSSNVPPYNFKEICEAVITLIDDPDAKIIIYPDLPSGADLIMTKKEAKELFEKPESDVKIKMKAHPVIDYINNTITFTSVPMQVTTNMIVSSLVSLRLAGKFSEIKEVNDRTTDQDGTKLEIVLDPSANPDDTLEKLYKAKTNLKKNNAAIITLIDDYTAVNYSVRSFLLSWIDYRRDMVRASLNSKLANLEEEQHINEIKVFLCQNDNIEKTLEIAKKSNNKEEYKENLMKAYKITSLQAKVIADMPTSSFNKDSRVSFQEKADKLKESIEELKSIIKSDSKVDKQIIKEMQEGIKKYGTGRKSKVISDDAVISDNSCIIGITEDGYIKKILNDGSPIGQVSKNPSSMMMAIPAHDSDALLLFDSFGNMHLAQVSSLPLLKEKNNGLQIVKYINLPKGARVVSSSILPKSVARIEDYFYIMITKKGFAKRVSLNSIIKTRTLANGSVKAIILNDDDELEVVLCTPNEKQDIIIFTDFGDGMRLPVNEIPLQLAGSKGTKVVTLKGSENIIGSNLMSPSDKYLVYVTTSGRVKRTELQYFPPMKKKDEPLCLINLESGENLVSVKSVSEKDSLIFYKKKSGSETIKVKDIPIKTRAAKADKMLKVLKGDIVLSMIVK